MRTNEKAARGATGAASNTNYIDGNDDTAHQQRKQALAADMRRESADHLGLAAGLSRSMVEPIGSAMKRKAGFHILREWHRGCYYAGIAYVGAR